MKNAKREMKRKGFTLVELLIVIVVIGVLSAMMMLSSTEAVSSAKAADIVSDLRNLKTAALAWYADNLDYVDGGFARPGTTTKFNISNLNNERSYILKYLNGDSNIDKAYQFIKGTSTNEWYVYYNQSDTNGGKQLTDTVKSKLEGRAKSTGLLGTPASNDVFEKSDTNVYMFIR